MVVRAVYHVKKSLIFNLNMYSRRWISKSASHSLTFSCNRFIRKEVYTTSYLPKLSHIHSNHIHPCIHGLHPSYLVDLHNTVKAILWVSVKTNSMKHKQKGETKKNINKNGGIRSEAQGLRPHTLYVTPIPPKKNKKEPPQK